MAFGPEQNVENIKSAFRAVVSGAKYFSVNFEEGSDGFVEPEIMALFQEPLSKFLPGRILAFQRAIFDEIGAYAELQKAEPGCFRAYFRLDMPRSELKDPIHKFLHSERFSRLCAELRISYMIFERKIYAPKRIAAEDLFPKYR